MASMQLEIVRISGLFGRFDHELDLRSPERITIVTAPNGYGKTVLLNLLTFFFTKQFLKIRRYEFKSIVLSFSDGVGITITRTRPKAQVGKAEEVQLTFEPFGIGEVEPFIFARPELEAREVAVVDRYLPFVTRLEPDRWFDDRTGRSYSLPEMIDLYSDQLPKSLQRLAELPTWLNELIQTTECYLIETQRLLQIELEPEVRIGVRRARQSHSVVEKNAEDLSQRIGEALKQYANEAQKLDQSFPKRVIEEFRRDPPDEEVIRARLQELELRRSQLVEAGLIDRSLAEQINAADVIAERDIRSLLRLYSDDTQAKLGVFDDLYAKISLFQRIIGDHLTFKRLIIDARTGMNILDQNNRPVPLNSLSSGEQHELVMIYDLLFRVSDQALILIDEPELSLHVAWQKRFIPDLQEIQKLRPIRVVIATHSPQIINERWDLAIELNGVPRDELH